MALYILLRLLLEQSGARVDWRDQTGGRTPLLLAARARQEAAVRMLIENGADPDLACGKVTPREVLRQEMPRLNIERITVRERPVENTVEMLAQLVERKGRGEEEEKRNLAIFKGVLAFLGVEEVSSRSVGGMTVLQRAAMAGREAHVALLLDYGVNPNLSTKEQPWRPVLLAAQRAHHGVLAVLATHTEEGAGVTTNWAVWSRDTEETVLHLVLKKSHKVALAGTGRDDGEQEARYRSCLDVLLQSQGSGIVKMQLGRVVNKKDRASGLGVARLANTALHYAVQLWAEPEVAALLDLGANIGVRNWRGETPLDRILPSTLEAFLDR